MTNNQQPLRLERLEHEERGPDSYTSSPSNFYKATANQNLWQENRATRAGVLLERVLSGTDATIDYEDRRKSTAYTDLWLIRFMRPEHEGRLLEKDEINDLLARNVPPSVRITQPTEYPSLLLAHRTVPVGKFALAALAALPEVEKVSPILAATGLYSMYDERTLTAIRVSPAVEMAQAEEIVHDMFTI